MVIPTTAMVASAVRYPGKAARIYQPAPGLAEGVLPALLDLR